MLDAYLLIALLGITLGLFIWGRWRYDIVAVFALLVAVSLGLVSYQTAFDGFGNAAVITVACVMIITQSIVRSGFVEKIVNHLTPLTGNLYMHIGVLCLVAIVLSAFMNNVGALALLMPVAIQTAIHSQRSPSLILMPLAFAAILGGLITSIGTPPNIIIASYRQEVLGQPYEMFDFTPVGIGVALAGLLFITFFGWRFIPIRRRVQRKSADMYQIQEYMTEINVPEDATIIGKTVSTIEQSLEGDFTIISMIRGNRKYTMVRGDENIQANDILVVEGTHDDLQHLLDKGKLTLVAEDEPVSPELLRSNKVSLVEAVVPMSSNVEGRSAKEMRLRSRYHVNLIAIAREGNPIKQRLNHVELRAGDVVLLQGSDENIHETIISLGFLPLIERGVEVGMKKRAVLPILIFACSIFLTAFSVVPVDMAFLGAVFFMMTFKLLPLRKLYESIDWSIVILLGAMIPIGTALQSTGGTDLIANAVLQMSGQLHPILIVALLFIITMILSGVMNNAATAVVMAPIGVSIAQTLQLNIDPFLMAVAISASCAFLTPIGHQNNTLVLGPGGYHFSDYVRLGLPLEIVVTIVAVPLIVYFWPL